MGKITKSDIARWVLEDCVSCIRWCGFQVIDYGHIKNNDLHYRWTIKPGYRSGEPEIWETLLTSDQLIRAVCNHIASKEDAMAKLLKWNYLTSLVDLDSPTWKWEKVEGARLYYKVLTKPLSLRSLYWWIRNPRVKFTPAMVVKECLSRGVTTTQLIGFNNYEGFEKQL